MTYFLNNPEQIGGVAITFIEESTLYQLTLALLITSYSDKVNLMKELTVVD